MKSAVLQLGVWCLLVPQLVGCNIFSPFTPNRNDADHLEEATKCLHQSDFDCAIDNYQRLSEGQLKNQQLCTTNLAKGGFTLKAVIAVVGDGGKLMLRNLAQILLPWTPQKSLIANQAKQFCVAFSDNATPEQVNLGVLVKTSSLLFHCATRIARSDVLRGVSDGDDDPCNTPGTADGKIDQSDVGPPDGVISAAAPGLCAADARACLADILAIDSAGLLAAGLVKMQTGVDLTKQALPTTPDAPAIRMGLLTLFPPATRSP